MDLFAALPSGLASIWLDTRVFLSSIRFDRPSYLWLGFIPLILSLLGWFSARRAQSRLLKIGRPSAVAALIGGANRKRRFVGLFRSLTWLALVIGLAGPRWGEGESDGVAVGRDIVLVVDLSRSMLADDGANGKARWQIAVTSSINLLDYLKSRGGHRVAVIVFAAKPLLLVPLTTDFDHARAKLSELNGRFPPPAVRPDRDDAPSGTRIGAAITFAVDSLDQRFVAYRDIILFSDGDDPANDREWALGVSAARKAGVPLNAVGIGDPDHASLISLGNGLVEFAADGGAPDPVRTRLQEDVLTAMTTEGHGQYLPARRTLPDMGLFVRNAVEKNPSRELEDDPIQQKKSRTAWFAAFGLLFLLLWWWRDR